MIYLTMSESPFTIPPPSSADDLLHEFHPFFKVHKDGRVERYAFHNQPSIAPGVDPKTGIKTKDIVISPDTRVVVRLFAPVSLETSEQKHPLIIHIHGGGFCVGSALDAITYNFVASLLSRIDAIVISVEYRLAPEHTLPTAYEDSWESLKWVGLHSTGSGPEPILNRVVDFNNVFLLGESAGANIAHHLAVRAGVEGLEGLRITGMIAVHPGADPNLANMGTGRVLVCLAGKDHLRGRGVEYYETLKKSGWVGSVELFESEDCDHCFHMFSQEEKAKELLQKFADFVKFK